MRSVFNRVVSFFKEEDGPTAVEYAVMLALIIMACLVTIKSLGQNTNSMYSSFNDNSGLGNGS